MRILFLTHRLPYALDRGDRIRAHYLLRQMSGFADVSLFSLVHDRAEEAEAARMPFALAVRTSRVTPIRTRVIGALRLPTRRPLTHSLLDAPGARAAITALVASSPPDVVVAYCSSMARFALAPPLESLPFVLDMVDVDSEKWRRLAATGPWPLRWLYRREAKTLGRFEAAATARAAATLVINDREGAALREIAPSARIHVLGNGIDTERFAAPGPPADSGVVIFTGLMNYGPNEQGVRWFADQVWPRVRAAKPEARFVVVGAAPTAAVKALAARDTSIEIVGRVDAVQPYLWQSVVAVAPLQIARGLQNKVLEALAAGLPVVATPAVVEGLPPVAQRGCVTAAEAVPFADAVIGLLRRSPGDRQRLAGHADLTSLTWAAQLRPLEGILRDACARSIGSTGK
jgi:sugar transferase (PEP-CTERM/EpsH1 system associated)